MVPFKPLSYRGEGETFQADYIPFQQANESLQSKYWSEYDIIYTPAVVWLMHSSLSEIGPSKFLSAHRKKENKPVKAMSGRKHRLE